MSRWNTARSFVVIAVINLLLTLCGFLYITHAASASKAREQRQGRAVERKLCTTLNSLSSLRPPPIDKPSDLSRLYLQREHQKLAQLGADVGCTAATTDEHP